MTFVIGDIHGEISKLKQLINHIYALDKNSQLIFLGDYINKGEDSKAVLDYLIQLDNAVFLMGNHEYYYLKYLENGNFKEQVYKYGSETTFIDFDMNLTNIKEKLYIPYKAFFDNLKLYYETDKYFISHAGIDVNFIAKSLNGIPTEKFLFNRYDFFKYNKKIRGKIAIFGHTGFSYPYYDGYKIGIDTAATYAKDNPLTAYCSDDSTFINNLGDRYSLDELNLDKSPWINRIEPYRLVKK